MEQNSYTVVADNKVTEVNTLGQEKDTTKRRKWEQFGEKERYQMEAPVRARRSIAEIAQQLGYSKRTIKQEQRAHRRVALTNTQGRSIEKRPEEIALRITEGHWEGDTVVGKPGTKECLFVLTERKSNLELIFKLKSKSQKCVVGVFDHLERKLGSKRFRRVFRTITFDNGSENPDMAGIEKSLYTKRARTTVYYAHPYSAWERGSNEVGNCLIRRFVPKGPDIGKLRDGDVKRIERWMNSYPRRKLHYRSAYEASSFGKLFSNGRDN